MVLAYGCISHHDTGEVSGRVSSKALNISQAGCLAALFQHPGQVKIRVDGKKTSRPHRPLWSLGAIETSMGDSAVTWIRALRFSFPKPQVLC